MLVALLAAAAAAVNFYLIPLEVLIAWRNPASLSIATDPSGASLRLDGVPLDRTAPITVSVRRDRTDHVIEATRPGYQPAREVVRYDKAVGLSFLLRLEKDPAAPPPAPPTDRDAGAARGGTDAPPRPLRADGQQPAAQRGRRQAPCKGHRSGVGRLCGWDRGGTDGFPQARRGGTGRGPGGGGGGAGAAPAPAAAAIAVVGPATARCTRRRRTILRPIPLMRTSSSTVRKGFFR